MDLLTGFTLSCSGFKEAYNASDRAGFPPRLQERASRFDEPEACLKVRTAAYNPIVAVPPD